VWQEHEASFCDGMLDDFKPCAVLLGSNRGVLAGIALVGQTILLSMCRATAISPSDIAIAIVDELEKLNYECPCFTAVY
jgi:hypothetical protein